MKSTIKLFVLLILSVQVQAQSKITEGKVNYTVTYPELTDEMKKMESMLPHEMTYYFKGDMSRGEMQGAAMGSMVFIINGKTNEMVMLMDMMGKKVAVKTTDADRKKMEAAQKEQGSLPQVKVTKVAGTKKIAGYECKKATIEVTIDGKVTTSECYYTDKLPKAKDQNDMYFKDIEGFMMEYSLTQSGMKMAIVVKSVEPQKVDVKLFEIPEGYEMMSPEDIEKMSGY